MGNKKCSKCDESKSRGDFPATGTICKNCKAAYLRQLRVVDPDWSKKRKEYRKKNRDKINAQKRDSYQRTATYAKASANKYYHNNKERCQERQRQYQAKAETVSIHTWLAKCMKHAKANDKRYGRDFDLDIEFLLGLYNLQNGCCAVTGVSMTHARNDLFSASVDRIDSKFGHTKGNIQLVCQTMNLAKREYSNDHMLDFLMAVATEINDIQQPDGFSYPKATMKMSLLGKEIIKKQLRDKMKIGFAPPSFKIVELNEDVDRIRQEVLDDYCIKNKWRMHKPSNKLFAGKKLIYQFHPHLWDVRTQGKPLVKEVWSDGPILDRALVNLVNSDTRISFDRIIRELIFVGAGLPSQMHPGFAKAVLLHFGCESNDVVYDPCAGWGARMLASHALGLQYHGVDLSRCTRDGLSRMSSFIGYGATLEYGDSLLLDVPKADIMFTSPPFGSELYIGSESDINLRELLDRTSNIKLRILHINEHMLGGLSPDHVITVKTRKQASASIGNEYLAVFKN